jgi:tRNA modification GTPase
MMLGDTIVARASAAGSSARAVIRISGPRARAVATAVFTPARDPVRTGEAPELLAVRAVVDGTVRVRGRDVAAFALVMVAPRSFTGEDVVELHVPGSPLLVELLLDALLADGAARGVRAALPGEYTARAAANGRLAAQQVEGLLLLLHAADERAAAAAVAWLHGSAGGEVADVRAALQDVLALLEAGLDFDDGDAGAVPAAQWRTPLPALAARVATLLAALPAAVPGGEVLLLGAANAGKSSLCNALAGRDAVLVDARPGTTRDLVRVELPGGGVLWDAPGDLDDAATADREALALRDRLGGAAAAGAVVLDATRPAAPASALATTLPCAAIVWTKVDLAAVPALPKALAPLAAAGVPVFATSAHTGAGLASLREHFAATARAGTVDAGGPLRLALAGAHAAIARAHEAAAPELAAVELQAALRALDGLHGAHSPEALLDRIYARFCLGK